MQEEVTLGSISNQASCVARFASQFLLCLLWAYFNELIGYAILYVLSSAVTQVEPRIYGNAIRAFKFKRQINITGIGQAASTTELTIIDSVLTSALPSLHLNCSALRREGSQCNAYE